MRPVPLLIAAVVALALLAGCGSTTRTVTSTHTVQAPPVIQTPPHHETSPSSGTVAAGCGIERWAVKTMTDPGANAVQLANVKSTTVAALDALRAPRNPTDRVRPVETTVWRLRAHLNAFKQETDSDIHVAIHDDAGHSMIVELPSPSCDHGSLVAAQIARARAAFVARFGQPTDRYQPLHGDATFVGVGFFDRIHGQRGVAPNGIELHPVLSISP